jgi:hypothetical protein
MSIDYLPDEMNYERSNLCWNEPATADAFNAGWRAACEAWQARAQAKAGPEPCKECNGTKRMWPGNPVSPLCNACRPRRVCDGPAPSPQPAPDFHGCPFPPVPQRVKDWLDGVPPQPAPDWRAACVVALHWFNRLLLWKEENDDAEFLPSYIANELVDQWPDFCGIAGPMKFCEAYAKVLDKARAALSAAEVKP